MTPASPLPPYCDVGMLLRAPIRRWRDIDQLRKVTSRGRATYVPLDEANGTFSVASHERRVSAAVDAARLLRCCSARERAVLFAHLALGMTLKQIAERFGICESRASQLYNGALRKMRAVATR